MSYDFFLQHLQFQGVFSLWKELVSFFRKLRKHKVTRIHMNLFLSMILQSLIRLIIYIDQFVRREDGFTVKASANETSNGIDNTVSCNTEASEVSWQGNILVAQQGLQA